MWSPVLRIVKRANIESAYCDVNPEKKMAARLQQIVLAKTGKSRMF